MRKKNKKKEINNKTVNTFIIIGIVALIASLVLMFIHNDDAYNHIVSIDYDKYNEIINSGEYNVILLTSPSCPHCRNYKKYVNRVCDDNKVNIKVYDLNISELDYNQYVDVHDMYSATKDNYNDEGELSILTPTTVITKSGDEVYSISGDLGYNGFLNLLKEYQLVE